MENNTNYIELYKRDERFSRLADLILEWNEKINVTAIRDKSEFMKKNVEDSLAILERPEF